MLIRVDINLPPALVNTDNPADDDISNIWPVVTLDWSDTDDSVNQMDHACHGSIDLLWFIFWNIRSLTCNITFCDEVTWHYYFKLSLIIHWVYNLINIFVVVPLDELHFVDGFHLSIFTYLFI